MGYYKKKKKDELVFKDKIMLSLLSLSGKPSHPEKSTLVKGVKIKCSFNYIHLLNEMGIKDNYINANKYRSLYLEFPLYDKKNPPDLDYGDLLECLIIDASSSSYYRRKLHIVSRIINKNLLLSYLKNIPNGDYYSDLLESFTVKQLYMAFIKQEIHKLISQFESSETTSNKKCFDEISKNFLLDGGYANYKQFFEVGTSFKEAKGAFELFGREAFKEVSENPYTLLRVSGVSFSKADIRAITSFKEDIWGVRRASVAFLSTIKHIIERGRFEAGSTAVSIKQIQYYGYLYMIGRKGAKTAHSYLEDILLKRGQTSRWNLIKTEEGKTNILKLLFKGAGEIKEKNTEYLLKTDNIPETLIKSAIEKINLGQETSYTHEDFEDNIEVNRLVLDTIIKDKIDEGETVIKFPSSKRVSTLGDFLLEMFTLNGVSKIISREVDAKQTSHLMNVFSDLKSSLTTPLTQKQEESVRAFIFNQFSILTGGPGTGKTYTVSAIVDLVKKSGLTFKLLAPTGKAAKRMSELAEDEPAQTIHMLLGFKGGTFFEVQQLDPIDFIVIDEFSMVDPILFGKFLSALHPHTRLLIVGDPDQLPSIRAGNLLSDLIKISEVYENLYGIHIITRLKEIMRQEKIDGEYPAIVKLSKNLMTAAKTQNHYIFLKDINDNLEGSANYPDTVLLVAKSNIDESVEKKEILKAFRSLLSKNEFDCDDNLFIGSNNLNRLQERGFFEGFNQGSWQIITPFRRAGAGKLASDSLNPVAREYINKQAYEKMERWAEERINANPKLKWKYNTYNMFSVGDKVLCTANIYKPTIMGMGTKDLIETSKILNFPIVNGDIGIIEEIYTTDNTSTYGKQISTTMEEIPEIYRQKQFPEVYGPFYKIKFEGKDGYTWFNSFDASKLSLGYVFTIHKSQGSEYDNLMTIITSRAKNFVTPKMLYTAMTRAKKKLFLVISQDVLESILLLAQKDRRFTVISQILDICGGLPPKNADIGDYPEEFKSLLRIYLNWMVIIRKRFNKMSNDISLSPYDFILKVIRTAKKTPYACIGDELAK